MQTLPATMENSGFAELTCEKFTVVDGGSLAAAGIGKAAVIVRISEYMHGIFNTLQIKGNMQQIIRGFK